MRLARFGPAGREKPGAFDASGRLRDLSDALRDVAAGPGGWPLSPDGLERLRRIDLAAQPPAPEGVRIGCCLADAPNIYGTGLNYSDRAETLGVEPPEAPIFFSKATSALAGPADAIRLPPGADRADFEVELAVVIGEPCYRIPESRALRAVAGYALANDLSERAIQAADGGQWLSGKSLPGFAPLGPWLLTADAVENPQAFRLRAALNGARMQDASTTDMLYSVAELISHLSHRLALRPGDVLLTGTPAGFGLDQTPARFLRPGDRLTLAGAADGLEEGDPDAEDGLGRHDALVSPAPLPTA